MAHFQLFLRGFVIVALQAMSVLVVSRASVLGAFVVSGALSAVWWGNARGAALSDLRFAREAYVFGAACGSAAVVWWA